MQTTVAVPLARQDATPDRYSTPDSAPEAAPLRDRSGTNYEIGL
ncbi:MAG TPA: hypothetical protein V6D46_10640 [Coleofasciculaceae cyanobacterium]